jgi:hypothetical protein
MMVMRKVMKMVVMMVVMMVVVMVKKMMLIRRSRSTVIRVDQCTTCI